MTPSFPTRRPPGLTRLAADALGATPMDRPEWTAGNPVIGEIYLTLTNSNASKRPLNGTDAANPRHYGDPNLSGPTSYGNPNGHIIRLREDGETTGPTTFKRSEEPTSKLQ